jgi:hypothetical protein
MARHENQTQQIVIRVGLGGNARSGPGIQGRIQRGFQVGDLHLAHRDFTAQFLMFAIEHGTAPQLVNGSVLGGRHQPGSGIFGNTRLRPLFERDQERFLREIFGEAYVAHDAREAGDQLGGFNAPDSVDGAVVVMWPTSQWMTKHFRGQSASCFAWKPSWGKGSVSVIFQGRGRGAAPPGERVNWDRRNHPASLRANSTSGAYPPRPGLLSY